MMTKMAPGIDFNTVFKATNRLLKLKSPIIIRAMLSIELIVLDVSNFILP